MYKKELFLNNDTLCITRNITWASSKQFISLSNRDVTARGQVIS